MNRVRVTGMRWLCAAGVFLAQPALAATPWSDECRDVGPQRQCILAQTLSNLQGDWLATLRLQPQGDDALLQIIVPAGVHLGSGIAYAVDGGPERLLTYRRCLAEGCEALRNLTSAEWQEVLRGASMTLVLRPDTGRSPAELKISLAGISALHRRTLQ